jgi:hypothetical protein
MWDGADTGNMPGGDPEEEDAEEQQTTAQTCGREQQVARQQPNTAIDENDPGDEPERGRSEEERPAGNGGLQKVKEHIRGRSVVKVNIRNQ